MVVVIVVVVVAEYLPAVHSQRPSPNYQDLSKESQDDEI
jgi:hypothetical protein